MTQPIRILIAALGGEGGSVLAGWIANAAIADGYVAQSTSVPGVAQRTGATTYYLEIVKADGRRPVLALSPTPGQVDLLIATEALEAARQVAYGLVSPDRTKVVASTHRFYSIHEKIALGDGRADTAALDAMVRHFAHQVLTTDVARLAQEQQTQTNAVLLGLASQVLPLSADAFRAAIRGDGRSVGSNLRGFEAGRGLANSPEPDLRASAALAPSPITKDGAYDLTGIPIECHTIVLEGIRRLTEFQSAAYAQRYVDHVRRFSAMKPATGAFLTVLARHLAVRMSSEDVVRVAQLKLRQSRIARVTAEARARPGEIVRITEYLKPGWGELLSMLPTPVARAGLKCVDAVGAGTLSFPLRVHTTGIRGQILLRLLAAMRPLRPSSLRAREERRWLNEWLALIERVLPGDPQAALEIVETARLVRGYGETWERGNRNWRTIVDHVITPLLADSPRVGQLGDAILQARLAAQADDSGKRLGAMVGALNSVQSTIA